ncbi:hypothetical protein HPB48_010657 [Haemaphysalis longicornis]|uniref:Uncharacterized protein n=1 Tax=Haemaphysalis longicornis TaxID=44386 RepID=A0A9J6FLH6_HAELO|nr:hypothetical protein HPB48_010657 [Haemaphysalis longicornis]
MDTAPSVPPAQGECASFSLQAEVEVIGQNKTSSEHTTDPSRNKPSLKEAQPPRRPTQALQTQIQTQTDQINRQIQALSAQVAQNGVQINEVVGRVDQLGTRIDRLEGRMETVESNSLRRRQAPYSRPPVSEARTWFHSPMSMLPNRQDSTTLLQLNSPRKSRQVSSSTTVSRHTLSPT